MCVACTCIDVCSMNVYRCVACTYTKWLAPAYHVRNICGAVYVYSVLAIIFGSNPHRQYTALGNPVCSFTCIIPLLLRMAAFCNTRIGIGRQNPHSQALSTLPSCIFHSATFLFRYLLTRSTFPSSQLPSPLLVSQ